MKVKQLISILLMLLLLTACSANTDLDLPDEAGSPSEGQRRTEGTSKNEGGPYPGSTKAKSPKRGKRQRQSDWLTP